MRAFDMYEWAIGSRRLMNQPLAATFGWRSVLAGERALLPAMPGTMQAAMRYLREYIGHGLGIHVEPIVVDSLDLLGAVQESLIPSGIIAGRALRNHLEAGGTVECFNGGPRTEQFITHFGIPRDRVHTAHTHAARRMDDKHLDRETTKKEGLPNIYAPHEGVENLADFPDCCRKFFESGHDEIIVRPSNLASGACQMRFTRSSFVDGTSDWFLTYMREMVERNPPAMLVEEYVPGATDFSVLFRVHPDGRIAGPVWTKQYVTPEGKHLGNLVAKDPKECCPHGLSPAVWEAVRAEVGKKVRTHVEWFAKHEGLGVICFDGIVTSGGRWVVTEKNIRCTAGSIAHEARLQCHADVLAIRNIALPKPMTWREIDDTLGEISVCKGMSRGTGLGVIIMNPVAALDVMHPMFTAFALADSAAGAEQTLDDAAARFDDTGIRFYRPQLDLVSLRVA